MSGYCTVDDVRAIVPKSIVIGTNLLEENTNVTVSQVETWIEYSSGIIDSYLSTFYRTPLVPYKEPDFTANPVTFREKYPPPITLINARLAAAHIYDNVFMAQQEPNVSDWGKNQRALAFDDLKLIQAGDIQLPGQELTGLRFVRQELLDPTRMPGKSKETVRTPERQAGQ